jgi:hypothetical protein
VTFDESDLIIRGRLLCIFFLVCLKVEFGMHVYVTIAYIRSVFLCTQSSIFFSFQIHIDGHYDKKLYFFQLRREARKFLGYFVWKITILCQKIKFSPILGDARAGCAPCWIRPWIVCLSPGRVKRKNIELVFTSSRLSMHHYRVPGSKDR